MRWTRLIAAGILSASLFSTNAFAAPAWNPEKSGLKFDNAARQDYMAKRMDTFFHPSPNARVKAFEAPDGWKYETFDLNGMKIERLKNPKSESSKRVVLQLHGGGYIGGLTDLYREFGVKQAVVTGAREVYMINYRLAPQNTFPAALDDAVAAYKYVLKKHGAKNIIVIGDSAGGNLALALSVYLKENNIQQPALMVLNSPWTTLETDLPSRTGNADRDVTLGNTNTRMYGEVCNPSYGGNLPLNDYRLSPLHADLTGFPPILIQTGGYETLLDDSVKFMGKAVADGVDVTLSVYAGMPHDFALVMPELQESIDMFKEIGSFVNRHMKN